MKVNIYAIQDSKAGIFLQPFPSINNATALRGFADAANKPDTNVGQHPSDYILFFLGTYDDQDGSFESVKIPVNLGTGNQFVGV